MHRQRKGKIGEYLIILKLIGKGFDVFPSLVDNRGVDIVIRNDKGTYIEIQIKSVWSESNAEWFQIQTLTDHGLIRNNFYIICLDKKKSCWIFPSSIFFDPKYTCKSKKKKGGYTFDLNLSIKRRENDKANRELLKQYKNNWKILRDAKN